MEAYIEDDDGVPVETYDNGDIRQLAKVFTGLGPAAYWNPWEDLSEEEVVWGVWYNSVPNIDATLPMIMFDEHHEGGVKHLLNGAATVDGWTGDEDIQYALDNPVLPFKRCAIHFKAFNNAIGEVKSHTRVYRKRVATVFESNENGVKGDLSSVVKAILLDEEARDCSWLEGQASGKMREPMIRYMEFLKSFDASNESGKMWATGWFLEGLQHPLNAPSVFNFFLQLTTFRFS